MEQDASQSRRLVQLEADVALLSRAVARLLNIPGHHGRWTRNDFVGLDELLERLDPPPEPTDGDEPVADPTDDTQQPPPPDDLSSPARLA